MYLFFAQTYKAFKNILNEIHIAVYYIVVLWIIDFINPEVKGPLKGILQTIIIFLCWNLLPIFFTAIIFSYLFASQSHWNVKGYPELRLSSCLQMWEELHYWFTTFGNSMVCQSFLHCLWLLFSGIKYTLDMVEREYYFFSTYYSFYSAVKMSFIAPLLKLHYTATLRDKLETPARLGNTNL